MPGESQLHHGPVAQGEQDLLDDPDETDPVRFGKYHSLTYGEVENHHKEYASWVINTAREDDCCPQLVRLATWLQRTTGTISKKGSQKSPPAQKPRKPSETPAPSTQSSPSQADTETAIHNLVGALQSLQKEVQELKEDRRTGRPDETMSEKSHSYIEIPEDSKPSRTQ